VLLCCKCARYNAWVWLWCYKFTPKRLARKKTGLELQKVVSCLIYVQRGLFYISYRYHISISLEQIIFTSSTKGTKTVFQTLVPATISLLIGLLYFKNTYHMYTFCKKTYLFINPAHFWTSTINSIIIEISSISIRYFCEIDFLTVSF